MMSLSLSDETPSALIVLWSKYRPAILHLMLAAVDGPQRYKLYSHEFRALVKDRTFTFVLQAHKGKAINDIRTSQIAQDLMSMLKLSRKACDQLEKFVYEFRLDNQFMLHVARVRTGHGF